MPERINQCSQIIDDGQVGVGLGYLRVSLLQVGAAYCSELRRRI